MRICCFSESYKKQEEINIHYAVNQEAGILSGLRHLLQKRQVLHEYFIIFVH